jgi:hypothetical protein
MGRETHEYVSRGGGKCKRMNIQSLVDWLRVMWLRGLDPDAARPIYPDVMSPEEMAALEASRAKPSRRSARKPARRAASRAQ